MPNHVSLQPSFCIAAKFTVKL